MTERMTMRRGRGRLATAVTGAATALGLVLSGAPGIAAPIDAQTSVIDGQRGRGNPKAYKFFAKVDGEPVHWDPCVKSGWRINVHRASKRAIPQAKEAMQRVKQATGLHFKYQGKTHTSPKNFSKYPGDTDLVMGWGPPKATGGAAGLGGPQWESTGEIIHGFVVLNYKVKLAPGFGRGPKYGSQGTEGQLMMHELGHAVGLQHVKDKAQIMYPTMSRKKATWGAGDRNGLRKVGTAADCF